MSGAQNWNGFANAGPSRPSQELRWIAQLDAQWPNLPPLGRTRAQRHADRWGPEASPQDPQAGTEDFLKAKLWRQNRSVPKCESCWASNAPMPAQANVPIGQDAIETLPCGCLWEYAMVELWAIGNPNNTWVLRQNNGKIAKMTRESRTALYASVKLTLGIGINTVLTYAALTQNGRTAIQSWPNGT